MTPICVIALLSDETGGLEQVALAPDRELYLVDADQAPDDWQSIIAKYNDDPRITVTGVLIDGKG